MFQVTDYKLLVKDLKCNFYKVINDENLFELNIPKVFNGKKRIINLSNCRIFTLQPVTCNNKNNNT